MARHIKHDAAPAGALSETDLFSQVGLALPEPSKETSLTETSSLVQKAPGAFKTISEAAELLDVPQHVLRFWESKFPQIKPTKLRGGRRYYRPQDIETLLTIKDLLYKQGYTIKGARKAFSEAKKHKKNTKLPAQKQRKLLEEASMLPVKAMNPVRKKALRSIQSELQMLKKELAELA